MYLKLCFVLGWIRIVVTSTPSRTGWMLCSRSTRTSTLWLTPRPSTGSSPLSGLSSSMISDHGKILSAGQRGFLLASCPTSAPSRLMLCRVKWIACTLALIVQSLTPGSVILLVKESSFKPVRPDHLLQIMFFDLCFNVTYFNLFICFVSKVDLWHNKFDLTIYRFFNDK